MSAPQWSVVDLGDGESGEMRALFEQVFGHAMPASMWHWKYGNGRGIAVGVRDTAGRLLGHYGGMRRSVAFRRAAAMAIQIGDVMVAPHVRGVLSRRGPFALMAQAFLDAHIGAGTPHLLGFGFPNERAMRLGEKLALYAPVDRVWELSWAVDRDDGRPRWHLPPIDWASSRDMDRLNRLWQRMSERGSDLVLPVRDADWWRHRYANHPQRQYRCHWVQSRLTRRTLGAVVVQAGHDGQPWEWMDWLAPMDRAPTMSEAALELARCGGATALMGWFSTRAADAFGTACATRRDTGVAVPMSIRRPGPARELQDGRWWLTSGDTDFR